jgi:type III restriction enzyme
MEAPADKSNMSKYVFGGFKRCLYPVQKFDSDSERKLSVILDRDSKKWFKPAKGQFQIYYLKDGNHPEYQPDFVAESDSVLYMIEPKQAKEMDDPEVLLKRDAAVLWCRHASDHANMNEAKPWKYLLVPHDAIATNMTLDGLAAHYEVKPENI